MTSGRIPEPTALKLLRGNPGRRPINRNEPRPKAQRPTCPSWLAPDAKRVWKQAVADMAVMGTLAACDRETLVVYCEAVVHHRQACEMVDGSGVLIKYRNTFVRNPVLTVVAASGATIVRIAAELGLTPSSRTRLSVQPTEREDEIARKYIS
jgi:P27 family predicted phage terminase small subunit